MHISVMLRILILIPLTFIICTLNAQQVADSSYNPAIMHPEYSSGKGPVVFIDSGHHNFHTRDGRYKPFASLLERDGYVVKDYSGTFTEDELMKGKILVISNALNEVNVDTWALPTPSAFTKTEIEQVKQWIQNGGSLFLIADHMPMAGAATELAAAFGFQFTNGFVKHDKTEGTGFFSKSDSSLAKCIITNGRNSNEVIDQIVTFTGQAFRIPVEATSVLTFDDHYTNLLPDTAWVFTDRTQKSTVKGWSQGAYRTFGKGRVVVFGEAAMFSAQLAGEKKNKMGMNDDRASQNYKLLLNIIHWLDGKL